MIRGRSWQINLGRGYSTTDATKYDGIETPWAIWHIVRAQASTSWWNHLEFWRSNLLGYDVLRLETETQEVPQNPRLCLCHKAAAIASSPCPPLINPSIHPSLPPSINQSIHPRSLTNAIAPKVTNHDSGRNLPLPSHPIALMTYWVLDPHRVVHFLASHPISTWAKCSAVQS